MPDILDDLRADLDAAFAHAETRTRRRRRRMLPLGALVMTAVLAVAVLVLRTAAPPAATAAQALRAVAHVAQASPAPMPRDDQFYYVRSRGTWLSMFAGVDQQHAHAASLIESDREIWLSADRPGQMVTRVIETRPLTPADAGRAQPPAMPGADGRPQRLGATGSYDIGGERLTRAQLLAFPTDPRAIYERVGALAGEGGRSAEGRLFDAIGTALRERPAPAALRAGLYRALALVPGVQLIGTVQDRAGRTGTAVARTEIGIRHELIFDPRTSELLADRQVLVDPARAEIDAPAGTIIGDAAYLERAVVDELR